MVDPHPAWTLGAVERNRAERICLIPNPKAAGGRVGKRLDALKTLADAAVENW